MAAPLLHCVEATNCAEPLADHLIDYGARAFGETGRENDRFGLYILHCCLTSTPLLRLLMLVRNTLLKVSCVQFVA